ncbi:hypothetical protein J2T11_001117 [Paenarthrobacter nicotinovorans]|jgi:hypothetical protein|uniref:hypothetical protein n=1 Tax=Paenarthrobacter nicotinovorans TaxID=29320 RepID=UPI0027806D26|nr:hypothetical protein [Paenarthrobacter nicotinovorans]MDP9934777.1 hypothetical protein [Paenarthrobacter nicotinovorans]
MGVDDSIRKATENAMEDLAGTSDPVDKDNVPEPGEKDDDIQVHSSISEGSNAMDSETPDEQADERSFAVDGHGETHEEHVHHDQGVTDSDINQDREGDRDVPSASGDVPGPAGLPEGDPDSLRADPSEGGEDPSTSMGRG